MPWPDDNDLSQLPDDDLVRLTWNQLQALPGGAAQPQPANGFASSFAGIAYDTRPYQSPAPQPGFVDDLVYHPDAMGGTDTRLGPLGVAVSDPQRFMRMMNAAKAAVASGSSPDDASSDGFTPRFGGGPLGNLAPLPRGADSSAVAMPPLPSGPPVDYGKGGASQPKVGYGPGTPTPQAPPALAAKPDDNALSGLPVETVVVTGRRGPRLLDEEPLATAPDANAMAEGAAGDTGIAASKSWIEKAKQTAAGNVLLDRLSAEGHHSVDAVGTLPDEHRLQPDQNLSGVTFEGVHNWQYRDENTKGGQHRAAGVLQLKPDTLKIAAKAVGLWNQPFNLENQRKVGQWLLENRAHLQDYLNNQTDDAGFTKKAGGTWAAVPRGQENPLISPPDWQSAMAKAKQAAAVASERYWANNGNFDADGAAAIGSRGW